MALNAADLIKADHEHWIHPLHHPVDDRHAGQGILPHCLAVSSFFVDSKVADSTMSFEACARMYSE